MGRTNEFTLVATADMSGKLGFAVQVDATLVDKTPTGKIAGKAEAIDGIITDITPGAKNQLLAVAKVGDIAFAKIGGAVTVGAKLEVGSDGRLVTYTSGVVVAKALATGKTGERIPVLIK